MSLRTVEEFGTSETVETDGKFYTSFRLPKFIISSAEDLHEVADAHLIAAAPRMADYIEKQAAAGDLEAAAIWSAICG